MAGHAFLKARNAGKLSLLELEYLAWVSVKAEKLERDLECGDMISVHKNLRTLLDFSTGHKSLRIRRVADENGKCAQTYNQERKNFRAHFAKLLDGTEMTFANVLDGMRSTPDSNRWQHTRVSE